MISTGSLGLDIALGTGGLPRGRIVEVYGPESSGKTTLALHVLAEAQRAGGVCAFIDAEHALDVGYARKLGVKTEDLLLSQPDNGEQALEITDMLVRSEAIDVIVIDSVAALVPKAELEGEMGDAHVGLQARLMSQALRKLTGACAARARPGHLHQPAAHEDRRDVREPGDDHGRQRAEVLRVGAAGRAADRRAEGRRAGGRQPHAREGGEEQDGGAVPRDGVRRRVRAGDLAARASHRPGVEAGLLEKSGAWIGYGGERLGNGREAARQYLLEHQDLLKEMPRPSCSRTRGSACSGGAIAAPAAVASGHAGGRPRAEGGLAMVSRCCPRS